MMKIERDSLVRYFLGQMSEEEKEALHQWLEADEANRKLFIRERIRFDASLLVDEEVVRAGKKRQRMPVWLVRCMEVAASLLVLLGGFYAYDRYQMAHAEKSYQCVSVPAGNRANLLLPDGTNVWLNAGTMYGAEGEGFMRWNIACPRSVLEEGLNRFCKYVCGK